MSGCRATAAKHDALAVGESPGLYAILPELRDGFAPYDPQEFLGTDLKPGDSVYLSGVDGLPAGVYPLLPARYALLPGAMLVSAVPGTLDAIPGIATRIADGTPDGTPIVAGYRTFAGSGIRDARYSGFTLRPGSYGRSLATYEDSRASTFNVDARPLAPDDAARLSLFATDSFDLAGRVLTAANGMGAGAAIDIAAPSLALRSPGTAGVEGAVNVDAATLSGWNAASLLLGGRRDSEGRAIQVTSDTLTFAAGTQLSGSEIIAVARDELRLESGSGLSATAGATAPEFDEEAPLVLAGENAGAAVLGVSNSRALTVARTASATEEAAIRTAAGSRIASGGSLLIDAPRAVTLAGEIAGQGATWALGSGDINFGGPATDLGLTLSAGSLAGLEGASRLQLSASRALMFNEALNLAQLDELRLDTPMMRGGAGVDAQLAAHVLTVRNSFAPAAAPPMVAGTGTLSLSASDLLIGPGVLGIDGFGELSLSAMREIVAVGTAQVSASGNVRMTAANIGAASDADLALHSAGLLSMIGAGELADTSRIGSELGGRIALSANDIDHAGSIRVASGRIELDAANSLTLRSGSLLDTSGVMVAAATRSVGSGGGALRLNSGGTLDALAGAELRVSGAGAADAGGISLASADHANIGATFFASAAAGSRGGAFVGDFGSLQDFAALNATLESGGFTERRALRVATGDLTLAAGQSLTARDVELATGAGVLSIAGRIDASSDNQRGRIALSGGGGLNVASSARIAARGGETLGRGGTLLLESEAGEVNLASGSVIALDGSEEAGRLTIRAAATADGMRLGTLASTISGVDAITLQPVLDFTLDAYPGAFEFGQVRSEVTAFTDVATPAMLARYANAGAPVVVRPGIDFNTDGDLTLDSLDLATWRFGGEAAALAFSATGGITINGTVSDGYRRIGAGSSARLEVLETASSSLSFNAGTDILLGANSRVRTGTGDLTLRAAGNVLFDEGASIYTGGIARGTDARLYAGRELRAADPGRAPRDQRRWRRGRSTRDAGGRRMADSPGTASGDAGGQ